MTGIGLDFGTTNSAACTIGLDGTLTMASFETPSSPERIFPSLLTFWQDDEKFGRSVNRYEGGQWAVEAFRDHSPDCRLIKSFKTYAANKQFSNTMIYGARYEFSDLLRVFLTAFNKHAQPATNWHESKVIIGRPVEFAGPHSDNQLALARYDAALKGFGFESIQYVFEPLAAAYYFFKDLKGEATIFVGDFGGGTSDYTLLRGKRVNSELTISPLASKGVGIAGDQFDHRIIQNTVAKAFGKGSKYRSFDKELDVPASYFSRLSHWSEASMFDGKKFMYELDILSKKSMEPTKIHRFKEFIRNRMIHSLIEEISHAKIELSGADKAVIRLEFSDGPFEVQVSRNDFESWIQPDVDRLDRLISETLATANLTACDVDVVFLTGGTSFVPAIQNLFASRFVNSTIKSHDQLTSVAQGLALIASDPDFDLQHRHKI